MNNIIEFKKDCIMKSFVSEITNISISHDYKIIDETIEGYFDLIGEYKVTMSSITTEEFSYTIPFTIALSSLIDKDTIDISINDFTYEIEKDILHIKVSLNMNYEEFVPEVINTPLLEEKDEMLDNDSFTDDNVYHNELMNSYKEDTKEVINKVIESVSTEEFVKYKVYIMREEDTLESIMIKYNVNLNTIKEYNDIEKLEIGSKIVIPCINE